MTDAAHELMLGSLDLLGRDLGNDFTIEAIGEGTDWGSPEPVEVAIRSLLQDGSLVSTLGHDNRTATIMVAVRASDSSGLALGEAALFGELGKRNTLSWTPPDGWGPTTVFEVVTSSLVHTLDDMGELMGRRGYAIRLVCEPFGRSVDLVTASTLPSGNTFISVDDCSSAVGWTGSDAVTVDDGLLVVSDAGDDKTWLQRTGAVDMTGTPLLRIQWNPLVGYKLGTLTVTADGKPLERVDHKVGFGNFVTDTFLSPPSFTTLRLTHSADSLVVDEVQRTDRSPFIGTARQLQRSLSVAGSARTQAVLEVSHPTSALGSTLVYTWPDTGKGYSPELRQFLTASGSTIGDSSLVSGKWNNTDTLIVFDAPAAQLPDGSYLILARVKSDTVGSFALNWTADTRFGDNVVGDPIDGSRTITFAAAGVWQYVALGRAVLPPVRVSAQGGAVVHVTIVAANPAAANLDLDDAWLFNTTIGALTIVDCGTGTPAPGGPSNRLWIDAATTNSPLPSISCGSLADRSDSFHAGSRVTSWGTHELVPSSMNVFTVTTGALDASVSLHHHPRWHTHAAQ